MQDNDSRFGDDTEAMDEWQAFLVDNRHLRYEDSDSNWDQLFGFLKGHQLYFTAESLHLGYVTLGDTLELIQRAEPIVIERPPAPAPTQPPAPIPSAARQEPTIWRNGKKIQFREATRI
jgi:hypothetical protein